jgi:hypothetical protein
MRSPSRISMISLQTRPSSLFLALSFSSVEAARHSRIPESAKKVSMLRFFRACRYLDSNLFSSRKKFSARSRFWPYLADCGHCLSPKTAFVRFVEINPNERKCKLYPSVEINRVSNRRVTKMLKERMNEKFNILRPPLIILWWIFQRDNRVLPYISDRKGASVHG